MRRSRAETYSSTCMTDIVSKDLHGGIISCPARRRDGKLNMMSHERLLVPVAESSVETQPYEVAGYRVVI